MTGFDGATFVERLRASGFTGDVEAGIGAREVASTDNSIYQVRPAAIAYPRERDDVSEILQAARAANLPLIARGGNTGTNGQSLGSGIIVDFARHMRAIGAIDRTGMTVEVEPGVVLDQLNHALHANGLFFPPTVSTATRATLGGMVATDASGKGSRRYGKTSDYIEALDVILADGTQWQAKPMSRREAEFLAQGDGTIALVHREALRIVDDFADEFERVFPVMNRGLTGYNVKDIYNVDTDRFSLIPLLAGSEGTLALTVGIRLRVAKRPVHRRLAIIRYSDFAAGLSHVPTLVRVDPLAIEILDDKVIGAAAGDPVWETLEALIGGGGTTSSIGALNFVEFAGDDPELLEDNLENLGRLIGEKVPGLVDWTPVRDETMIGRLWLLREKAVGLLARIGGTRQGTPFVEDTAVPPERLANYVADFRAILDSHGLTYGMFGHADVGCLHVRPFLDMKDPDQARLIRPISDAVAALTKQYGGLLWGEHGRGYRGEYSPFFFGPKLYPQLVSIKRAFDPHDILNPGKLASPDGALPEQIDRVQLRGTLDAAIPPDRAVDVERAVACNGNGACLSWDPTDVLCPSYKVTGDRAQSPKGRSALLRAWAREDAAQGTEAEAIEQALTESLSSCLACKACASRCPVRVDIPEMASRFWQRHYHRKSRPLAHHLFRWMEHGLALGRAMPWLVNFVLGSNLARRMAERCAGLIDIPNFNVGKLGRRLPIAAPHKLARLPESVKRWTLILAEDSFTASFDGSVFDGAARALRLLGYQVLRTPPRANGKHLHAMGWREAFTRVARRRSADLRDLMDTGVRVVGLDSATALLYEHEYRSAGVQGPALPTLESVLAEDIARGLLGAPRYSRRARVTLLGHCTEQALKSAALQQWQTVLRHFGIEATPRPVGCCGMAGLFGHRADQQIMSRSLFTQNWAPELAQGPVLATGFSCRAQAHRLSNTRPLHPIEHLANSLERLQPGTQ